MSLGSVLCYNAVCYGQYKLNYQQVKPKIKTNLIVPSEVFFSFESFCVGTGALGPVEHMATAIFCRFYFLTHKCYINSLIDLPFMHCYTLCFKSINFTLSLTLRQDHSDHNMLNLCSLYFKILLLRIY